MPALRSVRATHDDLHDLIYVYQKNGMLLDCETRLPAIITHGAAYIIRDGDQIVSCALTTTETDDKAMIGSVYTTETHRRNGLAFDCLVQLCGELVEKNKEIYRFYDSNNRALAALYSKLGFRDIGNWITATANSEPD